MKAFKFLAIVLLAFSAVGCCACRRAGNNAPVVGSEWRLVQLGGDAVSGSRPDSFTLTLSDDGKAAGRGDCNRYNGAYKAGANGKLSFDKNMIVTRMMCPGVELERRFLAALQTVDSHTVDGNRLLLLAKGEVVAIFDLVVEQK